MDAMGYVTGVIYFTPINFKWTLLINGFLRPSLWRQGHDLDHDQLGVHSLFSRGLKAVFLRFRFLFPNKNSQTINVY